MGYKFKSSCTMQVLIHVPCRCICVSTAYVLYTVYCILCSTSAIPRSLLPQFPLPKVHSFSVPAASCMCKYADRCISAYIHIHKHIHKHIHIHVHMHIHIPIRIRIHIHIHMHIHIQIHRQTYTDIHIYIHITDVDICMCMRIFPSFAVTPLPKNYTPKYLTSKREALVSTPRT